MTTMTMTPEMSALKTRLKSTWDSLDAPGQKAMHDDLTALWTNSNTATDGSTRVLAEYIEVIGIRSA